MRRFLIGECLLYALWCANTIGQDPNASFTVTGTLGSVVAPSATGETSAKEKNPSPVTAGYSVAEHRGRLENIARCRGAVRSCLRQHLVADYLPAQCCYNLGEYPATRPWSLEAFDEQELDRLRDHGIQIIQWFDDWADPLRLFGGDKYTPASPVHVRRFIEMAHQRGMEVLPYASSCSLQRTMREDAAPVEPPSRKSRICFELD